MRRILLALGLGAVGLVASAAGGLATPLVIGATLLAGGFGWFLGGAPTGPSGPEREAAGRDDPAPASDGGGSGE